MKKKIVFFDIDGTLIDEKSGNVPKSAIDAIHKAQQNGHLLFEFDKFVILYDATSDIQSMRQFLEQYFDIIERGEDFWECVPLGYSKATGIQYLLDYLDMDLEQSISIGDSTNDLSMLEYTGRSVAMGNSNPILFDKVTYITADVDKDGVAQALHHYELI